MLSHCGCFILTKLETNSTPQRSTHTLYLVRCSLPGLAKCQASSRDDRSRVELYFESYVAPFSALSSGERGIRTLDTRLTYTRFPSVRLQPLGHLPINVLWVILPFFITTEGVGFEPTVPFQAHLISNQAPSTTRPPLPNFPAQGVSMSKNDIFRGIRNYFITRPLCFLSFTNRAKKIC